MPGAHKIGAAVSGPRITGGNFMDITFFLNSGASCLAILYGTCDGLPVYVCLSLLLF